MSEEKKTIYLCLAHISKEGLEQKYVKETFDTNRVVPMGPNVNAFEEELRKLATSKVESCDYQKSCYLDTENSNENLEDTKIVCTSSGTAAVHLALIARGVQPGNKSMYKVLH